MSRHVVLLALIGVVVGCSRGDHSSVSGPSGGAAIQAAQKSHGPSYNTHLRGSEVVPPVQTEATAEAILFLSKDGTTLSYKILVNDGFGSVTGADIHCGAPGVPGPAVVTLSGSVASPSGTLASGAVTSGDQVVCPDGATLLEHMRTGNAYVDIHTVAYPGGEARGQIS